ncbi:hypothetical protein [Legionella sp.]|uniref:hypothetical protein n=1 Tax=Legionella sp. TaxID=459 RepID=UPI003CB8C2CE
MIDATYLFLYLAPIIAVFFIYFPLKRKQFHINKWQKSLNLTNHARVFHQLYQNINGFILSQQARKKYDTLDYVYGEIKFLPFIALLSLTKLNDETVFYDLGCGIGKAVLACAMVYPIRKSVGVELLPELYFQACKQVTQLAIVKNYTTQANKIEFILGDFLEVNLNEATFIFINSTAVFNPTWEKLCTRLERLPCLMTIITISKALRSKKFIVVTQTLVEMSWGIVFAYVHVRKKE